MAAAPPEPLRHKGALAAVAVSTKAKPPQPLLSGAARYKFLKKIGEGASGTVWEAADLRPGGPGVAIKKMFHGDKPKQANTCAHRLSLCRGAVAGRRRGGSTPCPASG